MVMEKDQMLNELRMGADIIMKGQQEEDLGELSGILIVDYILYS